MDRAAIVVLAEIFARNQIVDLVRRDQVNLATHHVTEQIVDIAAALERVAAIAVARLDLARQAKADRIHDRPADCGFGGHGVIIAIAHPTIAGELGGRLGGDQVDRPADRVAPIQAALRPAQHFDPLQIEQRRQLRFGARDIGAIDMQCDAGAGPGGGGIGAHAADEHLGLVEIIAERDRRDELLDILQIAHPGIGQRIAADRRHRDAHILQRLAALLRGDDDVHAVRLRQRGRGQAQARNRSEQDTNGA